MRLSVNGPHPLAANLKESFRNPAIGWETDSLFPQCKIIVDHHDRNIPEICCSNVRLESLILEQLNELDVRSVIVTRDVELRGILIRLPNFYDGDKQDAVERALFRALLFFSAGKTSVKPSLWERFKLFWTV